MIITIDGPAGTGKSTVVARGRGTARIRLPRHRRDVPRDRPGGPAPERQPRRPARAGVRRASTCKIEFDWSKRRPACCSTASPSATCCAAARRRGRRPTSPSCRPSARSLVASSSRSARSGRNLVTEGRDQGSVVFPHAELEVLTSTPRRPSAPPAGGAAPRTAARSSTTRTSSTASSTATTATPAGSVGPLAVPARRE